MCGSQNRPIDCLNPGIRLIDQPKLKTLDLMLHSAGLLITIATGNLQNFNGASNMDWNPSEGSYLAEPVETFIAFSAPFDSPAAVMVIYLEVLCDGKVLGDSSLFLGVVGPHDLSHHTVWCFQH